jgi:hypothetical protein
VILQCAVYNVLGIFSVEPARKGSHGDGCENPILWYVTPCSVVEMYHTAWYHTQKTVIFNGDCLSSEAETKRPVTVLCMIFVVL